MKRTNLIISLAVLAVIIFAAVFIVGSCGSTEVEDGVDSGKVIERSRRSVVVLEDDGERDKHPISKRSKKCQVGSRWPDCKR